MTADSDSVMSVYLSFPEVDWGLAFGCVWNDLFEFLGEANVVSSFPSNCFKAISGAMPYQVVEHAFVQLPFCRPTLPKLLIVIVETLPVFAELRQAMLVNILNPIGDRSSVLAPYLHDNPAFPTSSTVPAASFGGGTLRAGSNPLIVWYFCPRALTRTL